MSSAADSGQAAPAPGAARPPTYDRGPEGQAAFERAVARLWATDAWVNPQTGQPELNADLVLEGGGVKGIGLAGAILVLAEAGYHFRRTAGTSAGAIAAVLVAAIEKSGQPMTQLRTYLDAIQYPEFMQAGLIQRIFEKAGLVAKGCELVFRPGLYSGDYLRTWLAPRLAECGVETWADLALSPDDDPGMSLPDGQWYRAVVHVSDISRGTLARLPWDYGDFYGLPPDEQDVVGSVRASMSIPFFFVPVRTLARPSRARMPDGSVVAWPGGTVTWVDGGMLMNFPIGAFDRVDGAPPRWPTIGIKLSAQPGIQPADRPAGTALQEGIHCLTTATGQWDRYYVERATANRTIFVPNAGVKATDFNLGQPKQQELFRNGAEAATRFLIRWAGEGGVPRSAVQAVTAGRPPAAAVPAAG